MAVVPSLHAAWDRMKDDLDRLSATASEETIKEDLKRFIDGLAPAEALRFLDTVNNWLDDDELTPEEEEEIRLGMEEIARGEFVTVREYRERRGL